MEAQVDEAPQVEATEAPEEASAAGQPGDVFAPGEAPPPTLEEACLEHRAAVREEQRVIAEHEDARTEVQRLFLLRQHASQRRVFAERRLAVANLAVEDSDT